MYTKIWTAGTNKELDDLFEQLRQEQYQDTSHHLYKNYSKESFEECSAISLTFDQNDKPYFGSSILQRPCWPNSTFRIANRLWKIKNQRSSILDKRNGMIMFGNVIEAQLNYCYQHLNAELVFMSRQYNNWQKFAQDILMKHIGILFEYDSQLYLTCNNINDDTCWQKIMYHGNQSLLKDWRIK